MHKREECLHWQKKGKNGLFMGALLLFSMSMALSSYASNFSTSRPESPTTVTVRLQDTVRAIQQANTELESLNVQDIASTITFSDYLDFAAFQDYIQTYEVEIVQLQLRALSESGDRLTIFTKTSAGLDQTYDFLYEQAETDGFTIVGVTGLYALVDSKHLSAIAEDPATFLIDTTGDEYFTQNLSVANVTERDEEEIGRSVSFPRTLTWELEDAGVLRHNK